MSKDKNKTQQEETEIKVEGEQKPNEEGITTPTEEEATPDEDDEVKKLEEQVAELKDKYLRQVAEFDNYRKRTLKEKAELILNGGEKVLVALLPILDDLDRAIDNTEKGDNEGTLFEGVELIRQKLGKTLSGLGLSVIDTKGADFDTDYHEAVAMVPVQEPEQKGKILDCIQKGYKLNDKVIRHAKVAVGQ